MYTTSLRAWRSNVDEGVLLEWERDADSVCIPCYRVERKKIPEIIQALQEAQALIEGNQPRTVQLPDQP